MDYMENAKSWILGDYDEATKEAVHQLIDSGDTAALEDAFYKKLEFGTGGLRGKMGVGTNRMNKYTVGMATQGLANYILKNVPGGNHSVCISFDSRNNSAEFAKITAHVLANNGIAVWLYDKLRPIPLLSFAVRAKKATAGVMITASHNPKEYNGYKVFWSDGAQIISPVDKDIVAEVNKITDPSMVKFEPGDKCAEITLMGDEMDRAYMDAVTTLMLSPESVARHSGMKIVYTPLHGSGVRIVPALLDRVGFKNVYHVPEQDISDGNFPTVQSPNPENGEALTMAIAVADRENADLVLATDPDADRVGIAVRDDKGRMVLLNGNQTGSILTYYILRRRSELGTLHPGCYCVKTIVTTELIRAICDKFGYIMSSPASSTSPTSSAGTRARASLSAEERKATDSTSGSSSATRTLRFHAPWSPSARHGLRIRARRSMSFFRTSTGSLATTARPLSPSCVRARQVRRKSPPSWWR